MAAAERLIFGRVVSAGEWDPSAYVMRSRDEEPVRVRGSQSLDEFSCSSAITGQPLVVRGASASNGSVPPEAAGCYILPMEYSSTSEDPVVCHSPSLAL